MDEAVYTWAITAVDLQGDRSKAEVWFAAVRASYTEPEPTDNYAEFSARLLERGTDAGVDEAAVRTFTEDLQRYESSPLDVVAALSDRYDTLADQYVELLTAAYGEPDSEAYGEAEAWDAEAEEALWAWEDTAGEWSHYEDGQWVPQRSWDGSRWLVLNQEKTEWVVQRASDGERWWVLNEDRSEWVLEPGQEPISAQLPVPEATPIEATPVDVAPVEAAPVEAAPVAAEPVEAEAEPPVPVESLAPAEAVVATQVVAASLDEAMEEIDGLDELTEEEIQEVMARVLAEELEAS